MKRKKHERTLRRSCSKTKNKNAKSNNHINKH